MHYAASQGQEECLRMLLQAGGSFDVVNIDSQTCLDVAVGECRRLLQQQRQYRGFLLFSIDFLSNVSYLPRPNGVAVVPCNDSIYVLQDNRACNILKWQALP